MLTLSTFCFQGNVSLSSFLAAKGEKGQMELKAIF